MRYHSPPIVRMAIAQKKINQSTGEGIKKNHMHTACKCDVRKDRGVRGTGQTRRNINYITIVESSL